MRSSDGGFERTPAVTLAFAKRKGANAVTVSDDLLKRLEGVREKIDLRIFILR